MAEYVVQYVALPNADDLDRLNSALAARLGIGGYVRSPNARDAEGMFEWLVAAKQRFRIARVQTHVCRHDEGFGDCSGLVTEG
jgi:hypothetical protein